MYIYLKESFKKAFVVFLNIAVLVWSLGFPLGLSLYPQLANAAPPTPGFGGPNEGQTGVPKDAPIDRVFDQALSSATVNATTVLLQANTGNTQTGTPAGANLCSSVSLGADFNGTANVKIVCNHADLTNSTWYTFTIKGESTGVKNGGGEALVHDFSVHFQTGTFTGGGFTGGAAFAPQPVIMGTVPGPGSTLPANGKIVITFNPGGLDPNTSSMATSGDGSVLSTTNIQLFLQVNGVISGSNLLAGSNLSWSAVNKQLISTLPPTVAAGSFYRFVVKSTVKNTDGSLYGNGADYMVPFQAVANDIAAPTVVATFPSDGATSIDRALYDIVINFNKPLDSNTITSSTILLIPDSNGDGILTESTTTLPQILKVDSDGRTVHLSPLVALGTSTASLKHFIKVVSGAGGVKDLYGNAIASNIVKSFTTGTLINGVASDTTKPFILFANATNFQVSIGYSESMNATDAATLEKFTLESPVGTSVSLSGKPIEYQAFTKETFIRSLAIAPGQTFKITVATSTKDLNDNFFDNTGTPAKNTFTGTVGNATQTGPTGGGGSTGGSGGGMVDFFTMGTEPIMVMPDAQLAGATSQYRVEFKATTSIPVGGKIVLTYPSGFTFAATCDTKLDQFDNNDINGPSSNTVTFAPACDSLGRTVTLTTSGGATNPNDYIRFKLQGIVNSAVPKDFSTGGYTVDIKTKDASNNLLDSKTSMPFFLSTPGTQSVSGTIYTDSDKDDTKDTGESGISAATVCLGGPMIGFNCTTTDGSGNYTFGSLNNGYYHIEIPPQNLSGSGGMMYRDINLAGGANQTGVNFGIKPADGTINVSITGGPANERVDIMAFNSFDPMKGGFVAREATLNASGATTSVVGLPVSLGKWQVSVGPWMPKTPGTPPPPPTFNFMPPQPQEANIAVGATTASIAFTLQTANRAIKGIVVDGSGTGIPNVFVNARPAETSSGVFGGGFAQTSSDGTFSLNVVNGTYIIEGHMPGMPPSNQAEATVRDNVSAVDNNTSSDVYSDGALVTGNGITLKIAKADRSISGRVLDESGNAVAFAFVNGEKLDASSNFMGQFVGGPTDSSGNYTLYVNDGTWRLRAFAPGFGDLGTMTVTVAGSSVSSQNFQASAADFGTVSGTVFQDSDSDGVVDSGEGLGGAMINIWGANGGNGTGTSSDGTYSVKVKTGAGYVVEGFVPGKGPLAPTAAFAVTSAGVTGKNLSLAGTGVINVTVTGVNDAFVDVRDANGRGFGTGGGTNGLYNLTLPASTAGIAYTVKAQNPKYGLIGSQSVTLTKDSTQTITFSPPTLYTISGTITSTSAACASGVSVFLTDSTNGRHAGGSANANGAYSVQVPNGTYNLVSGKPGCVDNANPARIVVNGANISTGTNRTMAAADSTITGRVTLNSSNVGTKTMVFADNGSGKFVATEVETSTSGTSNNYTLRVTGGTWTVKARSDGYESSSASVTVASGGTSTQNLTLSAIAGYTIREARPSNVKPSQGGLVKNTDIGGNFEVNIPAGVFGSSANDATVTTKEKTSVIDPPTDSVDILGDKGIEITPTDASGNKISTLSSTAGSNVTIKIPYTESDIPSGTSESNLTVGVWSDEKQTWEALPTTVDTTNNILMATVTHFSDFAPMAPVGGASAPSTPTGVNAGSPGLNSALVSWTTVSGATGYSIYRDTSSGGSFPRLGSDPTVSSASQTSYTDSGLTCGTTYYYKVSSKNSDGESAASSSVSVNTMSCSGGGGGGGVSGGGNVAPAAQVQQQPAKAQPQAATPLTQQPAKVSQPFVSAPLAQVATLVENMIVRGANSAKVFLVKAGKLLYIPNAKAFSALGLKWTNVKEVDLSVIASTKETPLLRAAGTKNTYKVANGRKLLLTSKEFASAGYKNSDITEVNKAVITNTPSTSLIRFADSPKVYKIEKGKLRWIKTGDAFKRLKLNWDDVMVVDQKEVSNPKGKDIK